jgi:hypothetical protein
MKKNKIYPNDKTILLHLALQEKKMNWLNKKDFSMNEKTFWNRVKYLEDCGYVGVIRHAGLKNLYHSSSQKLKWKLENLKRFYSNKSGYDNYY